MRLPISSEPRQGRNRKPEARSPKPEAHVNKHHSRRRICGNRITSRIEGEFVLFMLGMAMSPEMAAAAGR